ncbi:MAG: tetratricopeptide repeat protein [Azonexus sp.]|uniref:L,D-transpeptidase Cds6 family protein n=1 Tax=Azonexus sp. TaxID=1872668 RepID=UPI0028397AA5|nr:tetratricopeptide repeat protein [Azonexus sp.]MDR0776497.1 tetratricopeptide repeat protein [Azonexus sp.]
MTIGLAIGLATPAFADELPEVQRLIKQGQYPQALEKVDAYLSTRPKDAQGRFLKGLIYTEMNKPTEAIGVFTRLSEDYPELPEPYNNLAVLYAQQRQYDKARTALEMAIRTHPSYAIAYENLGDVYAKLASQAYDKALQLDGSNAGTQNKLALIRDLITTSGKSNVKPTPAAAAPVVAVAPPPAPVKVAEAKPAAPPTASVVSTTPGSATPAAPAAVQPPPPAKPAEVKPAEAKPTPEPVPAPIAGAAGDDIAHAINAWASAWERKDMKAYLGAYATDFRTPKGISRKDWEAERTKRIAGKGGKISVKIEDLQTTINGDSATVKFRQHYAAPGLNSSATKTMTLARTGNRWLIKEENAR